MDRPEGRGRRSTGGSATSSLWFGRGTGERDPLSMHIGCIQIISRRMECLPNSTTTLAKSGRTKVKDLLVDSAHGGSADVLFPWFVGCDW